MNYCEGQWHNVDGSLSGVIEEKEKNSCQFRISNNGCALNDALEFQISILDYGG